jgi:hypothetical protein
MKRTATIVAQSKALLIEIPTAFFKSALAEAECAVIINENIKRRIRLNVLGVPDLFAGLSLDSSQLPSTCEKYEPGIVLDISSRVLILFNGQVKIFPPKRTPITVAANGQASCDTVVGILSPLGRPDGDTAEVLAEMVAVCIPHKALLAVQEQYPEIGRCWNALYGMRTGALLSKTAGGSAAPLRAASVP